MVSREKPRNGLGSMGTLIKDGAKGSRNHFWDFLLLNRDKIVRILWTVLIFVGFFLIVKRKTPRITPSPFTLANSTSFPCGSRSAEFGRDLWSLTVCLCES